MSDIRRDNDYSVIVFGNNRPLVKMERVHSLVTCSRWLDRSYKYASWDTMNVYARRSGRFIGQYKRGAFIPAFPR